MRRAAPALAAILACCASRIYGPYEAGFTPEADQAACDAGNTAACVRLGNAYYSGWGVPQDDDRTETLFTRACQLGDQDGCVAFAVHIQRHVPPIADGPKRAVALFETACAHDNGGGCLFLAYAYAGVDGQYVVKRDPARAHALFERACTLRESSGCTGAGIDYVEGRDGFLKDMSRAIDLYQKACDLGAGQACFDLSLWFEQGIGVPVDKARGAALHERACKLIGDHEPCVMF